MLAKLLDLNADVPAAQITGLFNTFTFYHMGSSQIDFQSRLFSIFMTLTICPPLIQQLQPKYLRFRSLYMSREANSKIYSWVAFTLGAVLVELPYSLIAGTIYFNCWWWGALGRGGSGLASAYTWLMLMLFEIFYVGFGQAIASLSPNDLLASILVPIFFLFVVSFCGVVVPYAALPHVSFPVIVEAPCGAAMLIFFLPVLAILDVLSNTLPLSPRRIARRCRARSRTRLRI